MNSLTVDEVKLNVLLVCYNQEMYIEDCVNSILAQETDFKFNVVVADDFSNDNTLDIIKKIASSAEIEFIFLESEENLGIHKNYNRAFKACNAEFIATLEGDDFWTTPLRLQKHVDFLKNHRECVMSANRRLQFNFEKSAYEIAVPDAVFNKYRVFNDSVTESFLLVTARDMIVSRFSGNYSCLVFRKKTIDALPENHFIINGFNELHLCVFICGGIAGKGGLMGYIGDFMTLRTMHTSSITGRRREDHVLKSAINGCDIGNSITKYKFDESFSEIKKHYKDRLTAIEKKANTWINAVTEYLLLRKDDFQYAIWGAYQEESAMFYDEITVRFPKAVLEKAINTIHVSNSKSFLNTEIITPDKIAELPLDTIIFVTDINAYNTAKSLLEEADRPFIFLKEKNTEAYNIEFIPIKYNRKLIFKEGSSDLNYLAGGFDYPETEHIWTNQETAVIQLPKSINKSDLTFTIYGNKLTSSQTVDIIINKNLYEKQEFLENKAEYIIKADNLKEKNIIIKLITSELYSPKELGMGEDTRTLGFALRSIGLYECDSK